MYQFLCFFALILLAPLAAMATEKTFTLTYQGTNKWVAQEDRAPLDALRSYINTTNHNTFYFTLPANNRPLQEGRMQVLTQSILAETLQNGSVFKEKKGTTNPNQIILKAWVPTQK